MSGWLLWVSDVKVPKLLAVGEREVGVVWLRRCPVFLRRGWIGTLIRTVRTKT